MPQKHAFDDEQFVRDLSSGRYTHRQLAEMHGMSVSLVGKIVRGERRPDLARRMAGAREDLIEQTRHQLARASLKAVRTLERAMRKPLPASAVAAARGVLRFALPTGPAARPRRLPPPWPAPGKPFSEEELRQIQENLDGPPPLLGLPGHLTTCLPSPNADPTPHAYRLPGDPATTRALPQSPGRPDDPDAREAR